MKELTAYMLDQYGEEIAEATPRLKGLIEQLRAEAVKQHPDIRLAKDGKAAGTINISDAKILYLLIRTFKPKVIFEIGTWIGTSSMIMAEALRKNGDGGKIYTYDQNQFYTLGNLYDDTIIPVNKHSEEGLSEIPSESTIEFIFADGELSFKTIRRLETRVAKDCVIATHDFVRPSEKGVLNLIRWQLKHICAYQYVLPEKNNSLQIDSTLALLLNETTATTLKLSKDSRLYKCLITMYLTITAVISKIHKKLKIKQ